MFYVDNLDVRQSRQANDIASIVKLAEERFRNSESKLEAKCRDYRKEFESVNKLFLSA